MPQAILVATAEQTGWLLWLIGPITNISSHIQLKAASEHCSHPALLQALLWDRESSALPETLGRRAAPGLSCGQLDGGSDQCHAPVTNYPCGFPQIHPLEEVGHTETLSPGLRRVAESAGLALSGPAAGWAMSAHTCVPHSLGTAPATPGHCFPWKHVPGSLGI